MSPKTEAEPLIGRTFRGYRILRKIAAGGMGAVYTVLQESLGRKLAAKILYEKLNRDPTCIERLHREALAAARLDHPNIVGVYDVFEDQGRHFLIMEYVEGESLVATLRRKRKLELRQAVRVLMQTAAALQAAHEIGIIHRDIKPGNILIDPDGKAKVVDFGIVKITSDDAHLTQTGFIVGTPHYISPEQALDGTADRRTDIYSLGATTYEMITGRRPFRGRSATEVIRRHIDDLLIPPNRIDPQIPVWLSDLVCKMMEKRPERRYQSCQELIDEIERLLKAARARSARVARPPPPTLPGVKLGPGAIPTRARPAAVERKVSYAERARAQGSDRLDRMLYDILDAKGEDELLEQIIDEEIERTHGPEPDRAQEEETFPTVRTTPEPESIGIRTASIRRREGSRIILFLIVTTLLLAGAVLWEDITEWGRALIGQITASSTTDPGDGDGK